MVSRNTNIDAATYFTGWIMFILSLLTVAVLIHRLDGGTGGSVVTFLLVMIACAASYTVGQL